MKQSIQIIAIVLAFVAIGVATMFAYRSLNPKGIDDTKSTESIPKQEVAEPTTRSFASAKGSTIELDNWPEDGVITSPFVLKGKVPGNWSFEGAFPIEAVFEGDIGGPAGTARLEGDWMTEKMVPFTAVLNFDEKLQASNDVMLMLRNANPSGNPENDDSLALKVRFS